MQRVRVYFTARSIRKKVSDQWAERSASLLFLADRIRRLQSQDLNWDLLPGCSVSDGHDSPLELARGSLTTVWHICGPLLS